MIFYRLKDTEISMEKKRYKILITGVAGFLGSHLAEKLSEKNHQVVGVDNMTGGYKDNVPKKIKFFEYPCQTDY